MYIGHYGFAYYLKKESNKKKKKSDEIPLWLIFISVQLADFLCFIFIILGIEKMKFSPNINPWLRTHLEYFPYSHSLFANAVLAIIVLLIFWKLKDKIWGIILSIGVVSHWVIDYIVHTPDLPIFLDSYKSGLGLWNLPWVTFIIEILMVVLGCYYLYRGTNKIIKPIVVTSLMLIFISKMFFFQDPEIVTTNMMVRAIIPLIINSIFVALAYWIER